MSGFDFNNMGGLMQMAQQKMQELKDGAEKLRCTGTAGGGLVKVTVSGSYQVLSVDIDPKAMGDRELLEDLVRAATSDALQSRTPRSASAARSEDTWGRATGTR